jgi:CheY-like chemotaxis protein
LEERAALRRAAHDLNNLLGVVLGNAELLRFASAGPAPELRAIEEACERGRALIQLVQAVGRGEAPAAAPAAPPAPAWGERPPGSPPSAPGLPALTAEGAGAQGRALVVDDEPSILRITGRLMERCGYAVVTATSAQVAIGELERGAFGVVLSDFAMPGRTGAALLAEVAARWPEVTAVLMSGHATHAEVVAAVQREQRVLLRKPFTLPELRQAIARARSGAGQAPA